MPVADLEIVRPHFAPIHISDFKLPRVFCKQARGRAVLLLSPGSPLANPMADDQFETAAAARHIAARVNGAELIVYPTGGHVWIGRQDELFAAVDDFLRRTA